MHLLPSRPQLPLVSHLVQPFNAEALQHWPPHAPLWQSEVAVQLLPSRPQLPLASHLVQPFNAALQHRSPPPAYLHSAPASMNRCF